MWLRRLFFSVFAKVCEQEDLRDCLWADWLASFSPVDLFRRNNQHFGKEISNTKFLHRWRKFRFSLVNFETIYLRLFFVPTFCVGLIGSACDVGVIFTTLTASYLGKSSHKTRWVAFGTVLVGLSCFVHMIPHWLYGPGENALQLTKEHNAHHFVINNGSKETAGLERKLIEINKVKIIAYCSRCKNVSVRRQEHERRRGLRKIADWKHCHFYFPDRPHYARSW